MKMTYIPRLPVNTAALTHSMLVVAEDPSGILTPGNVPALLALKRPKVFGTNQRWTFKVRASEEDHLLWTSTSIIIPAPQRFAICFYAANLVTATTYADYFVEWEVELRGSQ
jgi:hypothetical protein